jgi:hypothetical protein
MLGLICAWMWSAALGASVVVPAEEAVWAVVRTEADGLVLEERPVKDSGFYELRVRTRVAAAPSKVADAVWAWNPKGPEAAMVARREVLSDGKTQRTVYSLFTPPLVGKRETTIQFTRSREGKGAVRIVYGTQAETAAPREDGAVQMKVRGTWSLQPDGEGGTQLEHRCLSDPGAGVAPFMASGTQRDTLVAVARDVIARAK